MKPKVCRSLKDTILFAMDQEEKARDFYLSCMEWVINPGVRAFFKEMAAEEAAHLKLLQETRVTDADKLLPSDVADYHLSEFMVDVKFTPEMTYQEALVMAMKKEEKAYVFYSAWQGRCASENISNVFAHLATEELKHKKKIEAIYDSEILQWD